MQLTQVVCSTSDCTAKHFRSPGMEINMFTSVSCGCCPGIYYYIVTKLESCGCVCVLPVTLRLLCWWIRFSSNQSLHLHPSAVCKHTVALLLLSTSNILMLGIRNTQQNPNETSCCGQGKLLWRENVLVDGYWQCISTMGCLMWTQRLIIVMHHRTECN